MRKILAAMAMLLVLAGCSPDTRPRAENDVPGYVANRPSIYATVGEEVPPANILGSTYNRGEVKEDTKWGQFSTGAQWLWGIVRDAMGK